MLCYNNISVLLFILYSMSPTLVTTSTELMAISSNTKRNWMNPCIEIPVSSFDLCLDPLLCNLPLQFDDELLPSIKVGCSQELLQNEFDGKIGSLSSKTDKVSSIFHSSNSLGISDRRSYSLANLKNIFGYHQIPELFESNSVTTTHTKFDPISLKTITTVTTVTTVVDDDVVLSSDVSDKKDNVNFIHNIDDGTCHCVNKLSGISSSSKLLYWAMIVNLSVLLSLACLLGCLYYFGFFSERLKEDVDKRRIISQDEQTFLDSGVNNLTNEFRLKVNESLNSLIDSPIRSQDNDSYLSTPISKPKAPLIYNAANQSPDTKSNISYEANAISPVIKNLESPNSPVILASPMIQRESPQTPMKSSVSSSPMKSPLPMSIHRGFLVLKLNRHGKFVQRLLMFSGDKKRLFWRDVPKDKSRPILYPHVEESVSIGKVSDILTFPNKNFPTKWVINSKLPKEKYPLCISLITPERSIDLLTTNMLEKENLLNAFKYVCNK